MPHVLDPLDDSVIQGVARSCCVCSCGFCFPLVKCTCTFLLRYFPRFKLQFVLTNSDS
jgi:hypothetical protein